MNTTENIAKSFYEFHRTGQFVPAIQDISVLSMAEAYECQRIYQAMAIAEGDCPIGYKVGCTSAAIRKQFGFDEPICGRLMKSGLVEEDELLKANDYYSLAIEPEFVIRIGRDLSDKDASVSKLLDAIECVQPGIELHHYVYQYPNPTRQELICSNGIHAGQVIGKKRVAAHEIHWELEGVAVHVNGALVASGVAADIMNGPLNSLRFLIGHLASRGQVLRAGDIVIPGSATALIPVVSGDTVSCSFTNIGEVTAAFT